MAVQRGQFTDEQKEIIVRASQLVSDGISNAEEQLTNIKAREFLKDVVIGTVANMKKTILSVPALFVSFCKQMMELIRPFSSGSKQAGE